MVSDRGYRSVSGAGFVYWGIEMTKVVFHYHGLKARHTGNFSHSTFKLTMFDASHLMGGTGKIKELGKVHLKIQSCC